MSHSLEIEFNMVRTRNAQTRLQFTPIPSSSPSKKDYSSSVKDRLANVRFHSPERRQSRKREVASIPTPDPSSQPQVGPDETHELAPSQDEEDDEIASPATKRRRISTRRPRQTTLTPRRSSRIQCETLPELRPSSSASSSSSQRFRSVELASPITSRRTRSAQSEKAPIQSSPPLRLNTILYDLGSPEKSEEDDNIIATRATIQRRRPKKPPAARDEFVVSDNEILAPFDDEDGGPVTPSQRRKPKSADQTPKSCRLKSRREHQELKEDLEDLQDSDSPELQISRTRGAPVNKERERRRQYIELLKRRRAGEKEPTQSDHEEEEEVEEIDSIANYAATPSHTFFNQRSHGQEGASSSEEDDMPQNPSLDIDEDDFVVSDEEELSSNGLGRPHPDIPLEFTSYASAKPRELFVYVVEWLVKNKIAPAFTRDDPLWTLAFTKTEAEIKAQAGSRLTSSTWTGIFMVALDARPGLTTTLLPPDNDFFHSCDACNKTNHPAKYEFVFSGSAYHHGSLEPVDPDSSADAEANHDNESVDSRGRTLPNTATHFFLGRYCAAGAELAHKFKHWKYNLNQDIMSYLESQGVLSAEEIVRRERSKGGQKKREREAEAIVDQMKATGVIDDLWRSFKADLEDARLGMEGHERKGTRGNKRIGSVRVPISDVLRVEEGGVEKAAERDITAHSRREKPKTKLFPSDGEGD
jgi:Domain of unknown function (DUF4211)